VSKREVAEDRARAILAAQEVTAAQERAACIVLAGKALDAAGGDWDTARTILRGPLEAIGAIPYDTGQPRGTWGR
jgi:hypothetical protein